MIDSIREAVREEIERQGLTQRHVAEKCDISFVYLNYFLTGHQGRGMNLQTLASLLKFLRLEMKVVRVKRKKVKA